MLFEYGVHRTLDLNSALRSSQDPSNQAGVDTGMSAPVSNGEKNCKGRSYRLQWSVHEFKTPALDELMVDIRDKQNLLPVFVVEMKWFCVALRPEMGNYLQVVVPVNLQTVFFLLAYRHAHTTEQHC